MRRLKFITILAAAIIMIIALTLFLTLMISNRRKNIVLEQKEHHDLITIDHNKRHIIFTYQEAMDIKMENYFYLAEYKYEIREEWKAIIKVIPFIMNNDTNYQLYIYKNDHYIVYDITLDFHLIN